MLDPVSTSYLSGSLSRIRCYDSIEGQIFLRNILVYLLSKSELKLAHSLKSMESTVTNLMILQSISRRLSFEGVSSS